MIDTGDTVCHLPSGEEWTVAYAKDNRLAWCGWPFGEARLSDCVLIEKATKSKRLELLQNLAKGSSEDPRKAYAKDRLEKDNEL